MKSCMFNSERSRQDVIHRAVGTAARVRSASGCHYEVLCSIAEGLPVRSCGENSNIFAIVFNIDNLSVGYNFEAVRFGLRQQQIPNILCAHAFRKYSVLFACDGLDSVRFEVAYEIVVAIFVEYLADGATGRAVAAQEILDAAGMCDITMAISAHQEFCAYSRGGLEDNAAAVQIGSAHKSGCAGTDYYGIAVRSIYEGIIMKCDFCRCPGRVVYICILFQIHLLGV